MTDRISYFAYVRHADRRAYERIGWRFSCHLGTPHGVYSALFEWSGPGPPRVPDRDAARADADGCAPARGEPR